MDYIFLKLGVNSSSIENPIVMTETLCNPNYSRKCIFFFFFFFFFFLNLLIIIILIELIVSLMLLLYN